MSGLPSVVHDRLIVVFQLSLHIWEIYVSAGCVLSVQGVRGVRWFVQGTEKGAISFQWF